MNGLARRRFVLVGLCLCVAGCAAQKIPIEPFASDAANEAPPPKVTDDLKLSVDHGPPPESPYARNSQQLATEPPPSRAATPVSFTAATSLPESARKEPTRGTPPVGDPAALARVVAELQSIGPIDPALQTRLVEDLRQTDPAVWPTLLQTFKAGVAFKQRSAAASPTSAPSAGAEKAAAADKIAEPAAPPTIPPSILAQLRTQETTNPFANLPLDALGGGGLAPRNGAAPGLALPTQTILQAAMAEAHRKDEEQSRKPPTVAKVTMHLERDPEEPAEKPSADATEGAAKAETAAWRDSLQAAIAGLEAETREAPRNASEVSRHAWLRMMYLTAGRREDALKPIPGIAVAEQDFWSEQIYGLATYLDTEKLSDPARRSAEARTHLAKAEKRLSEASTLAVKNLSFCTEVSSYGVYEKFKDYRFKAGQPLILYTEVENFRSEESAKGHHTALRSSYQILDPQGRRVAEQDLALTEEYCQNERRDYFIRYFVSVPERIYDGKYTLQLTIVDTLSQKIGQSTIDFTVGEEKKTP